VDLHKEAYHRWLGNERDALYWECLSNKMEAADGRLHLASAIFSSAAFVSVVANAVVDFGWPSVVKGLLIGGFTILGAGLSFYSYSRGYGKKAAKYAMMHGMCLQQIESWKCVRDASFEGEIVSNDLLREIRMRDAALQAHEAGHRVDESVALTCENRVRRLERAFRGKYTTGGNP
jgi:hypothetical protein